MVASCKLRLASLEQPMLFYFATVKEAGLKVTKEYM
jgi:hypothetical protein